MEIFGSISGLKVNTDKTKLIWIGKKKHCKDKLITKGLQWGCTQFDLLGLTFSVDLDSMFDLNLSAKLTEIKDLINIWNRRYLTPIGKVTVIRTFFLAKLNHLFLSLPNPNDIWLTQLNDILFKFIWSDKPDKINRKTLMKENCLGGIKMINVKLFLSSLKTSWLRRLFRGKDSTPWIKLFQLTVNSKLDRIVTLGPEYIKLLKQWTTNKFWLHTFDSWYNVLNNQIFQSKSHLLTSPIWYNNKISAEPLFFSDWYLKGIITVSDILDPRGTIMRCNQLQRLYNLDHVNFLSYLHVKLNALKFLKDNDPQDNDSLARPFIPNHIRIIFKSSKGVSDFYRCLISMEKNKHSSKKRWSTDLNTHINEQQWKYIYRTCFKTIQNNNLIWFQMKVLYRILGTKQYLQKVGLSDCSLCLRCNNVSESILHSFCQCGQVKLFWEAIEKYLVEKINFKIKFTDFIIICGYPLHDQNNIPINTLIIVTKKYIFETSKSGSRLNISALKHKLCQIYTDECLLSKIGKMEEKFVKTWLQWLPVFSE